MTKPVRKRFDRALYEAYDQKAKETLEKHLTEIGHEILRTEENFGVDIVSTKDGITHYSEAEVKVAWSGDWPSHWEEVRIPERKVRLLEKYRPKGGALTFFVFDKDLAKAWRIDGDDLTQDRLREAKGRYIQKGETFFHIPYTEAELVVMQ